MSNTNRKEWEIRVGLYPPWFGTAKLGKLFENQNIMLTETELQGFISVCRRVESSQAAVSTEKGPCRNHSRFISSKKNTKATVLEDNIRQSGVD